MVTLVFFAYDTKFLKKNMFRWNYSLKCLFKSRLRCVLYLFIKYNVTLLTRGNYCLQNVFLFVTHATGWNESLERT